MHLFLFAPLVDPPIGALWGLRCLHSAPAVVMAPPAPESHAVTPTASWTRATHFRARTKILPTTRGGVRRQWLCRRPLLQFAIFAERRSSAAFAPLRPNSGRGSAWGLAERHALAREDGFCQDPGALVHETALALSEAGGGPAGRVGAGA